MPKAPKLKLRVRVSQTARQLLLDTIPVLVGVLVALLLESWWEDYKADRRQADALVHAIEEFENNREELIENNYASSILLDSLQGHMNDDVSIETIVENVGGMSLPELSNANWEAYKLQNPERMDYELVRLFSNIDRIFELVIEDQNEMVKYLRDHFTDNTPEAKQTMAIRLGFLVGLQETLLEVLNEFLEAEQVKVHRTEAMQDSARVDTSAL